jgi:predicted nucleic acid-binding protein
MTTKPEDNKPFPPPRPITNTRELVETLCATIRGPDGTVLPCFCNTTVNALNLKEQDVAGRLLEVVSNHRDYIVNGPDEEEIARIKEWGKKFEAVLATYVDARLGKDPRKMN